MFVCAALHGGGGRGGAGERCGRGASAVAAFRAGGCGWHHRVHPAAVATMITDCTALILAGGDSSRMGQDKAGLLLDGTTLLQRVTATMQDIFTAVIVSVRQPRAEVALPQV